MILGKIDKISSRSDFIKILVPISRKRTKRTSVITIKYNIIKVVISEISNKNPFVNGWLQFMALQLPEQMTPQVKSKMWR